MIVNVLSHQSLSEVHQNQYGTKGKEDLYSNARDDELSHAIKSGHAADLAHRRGGEDAALQHFHCFFIFFLEILRFLLSYSSRAEIRSVVLLSKETD